MADNPSRIVLGVTGASGAVYALRAMEILSQARVETHLVISRAAERTIPDELDITARKFAEGATRRYAAGDIGAPVASGSFLTSGMLIAPCSVKTMSEIASGITGSLISRAADVVLKERRRLVLMVRETPFHPGHLHTMIRLTDMGAIIAPPLPAFYTRPRTVTDMVDQSVGRVLDLFDIHVPVTKRWKEGNTAKRPGNG